MRVSPEGEKILRPIPIWTVTQSLWKLKKSREEALKVEAKLSRPIIESSGKERERHSIYYWDRWQTSCFRQ